MRVSLIFTDIEVPLILRLLWLQYKNLIINFDSMTICWQNLSLIFTDDMNDWLDLNSLSSGLPTDLSFITLRAPHSIPV